MWEDIIEMDIKERVWRGLSVCNGHSSESSGSVKRREFLD
jgi:hypothetical protein